MLAFDFADNAGMSPARKEPDKSTYSGRFAARLRLLRDKSGYTPEQLIERIERFNDSDRKPPGKQAYYGWEHGTGCPHFDLLPAIAKALKVKILDLLPSK